MDSRSERASEELNLTGICWVYERPTGDKIFYLSTRLQFGSAERTAYDTPSGDYRIQETLGQQAEPGTQFFQKYVLNADLPESIKRRLVERGPVFRNAKLDSAGFETSIPDSVLGHLDSAEDFALYNEIRDATHRFTAEALERIPDVPDVEATVRLRFETLRFLNPASGAWQVWLLGSVLAGDLTPSSADEGAILEATGRYAVLHEETLADGDLSPISIPAASIPEDAGLPLRGVFASPPGVVTLTTVVEDQNRPGTGAWAQDTIQVPSVGGLPQLSDIAIAQSEGGNWTRDGQTFLHVTPAHITNPDGSLHAYFEVYGIRPGRRYDIEVRMVPTEAADRIWRLDPDDLAFRFQFTSEMQSDIGRHHLRLDLGDTEPGQYVLAVRSQDEETKAYSLPAVTHVFVAKR